MLELPNVTLVCVDCINHDAAALALGKCLAQCRFARAVFITDKKASIQVEGLEYGIIPRISSREAYSQFMLGGLGDYVATSHVLVVQWDGYVVNAEAWSPEFLEYDYIGAKWWHKEGPNVGNGGFSLRSAKLLKALKELDFRGSTQNEDDLICRTYRADLESRAQIRFASESVADRFAYERVKSPGSGVPFGYHGLFNMWRVLDGQELRRLFSLLHPRTVAYVETLELAAAYLNEKQYDEALFVCTRALDVNPDNTTALKLLAKASLLSGRSWMLTSALKELIRLEPKNAEYPSNLGDVFVNTGRIQDAMKQFRRVLELKPGDKVTLQKVQKLGAQVRA